MARDHARILTSIHGDPDAQRLEPLEQWVYTYVLLARKDINYAGLLSYNPQAWAKASKSATAQLIVDQLAGLVAAGFVVVDEDTFEVFIRSLMRNDGIAKQPNTLVSACRYAVQAESPLIRAALARELRRIAADDEFHLNFPAATAVHDAVAELDPDGPPPPEVQVDPLPPKSSGKGSRKTSAKPTGRRNQVGSSEASESTQTEDIPDDISEGPGVGEGVGKGESPSQGVKVGGRAHAGGPPNDGRFPEQLCGRHHDPAPPCGACAGARYETKVQRDLEVHARWVRQQEAERCDWCARFGGWIEDPVSRDPLARCDHKTDPRFVVARFQGETA